MNETKIARELVILAREMVSETRVNPSGEYVLLSKRTGGGYYGGGSSIHAPRMVRKEDDAIVWTGRKLLEMAYDWRMDWKAIELN